MLPISVCIIAKNEEKYLETCLKKLRRYDWEIIVTDTGSTDRTLEIASHYADQLLHFPWINDFSAARNYGISHALHDWILSVDSDEYLENNEPDEILLKHLQDCFRNPASIGMVEIISPFSSSMGPSTNRELIGRFFHKKHYHYEGKVHEQPLSLNASAPSYQPSPFSLFHKGYSDPVLLQKKARRNISLLKHSLLENPSDPYMYYQLGESYFVIGEMQNAYETLKKGLTFDVNPELQYVKIMVKSYGHTMLNLKKYDEALSFEGIYEAFSSYADFVFLMGLIYMNNGLFEASIEQFLAATRLEDYSTEGSNSFLAFYNIGVIWECLGEKQKALAYYQRCNSYPPALEGLKRLGDS